MKVFSFFGLSYWTAAAVFLFWFARQGVINDEWSTIVLFLLAVSVIWQCWTSFDSDFQRYAALKNRLKDAQERAKRTPHATESETLKSK